MKGLLYASLTVAWLVALRREAARLRWLRWLDGWCKDAEDFHVRIAAGWPEAPAPTRVPVRMTSPGDATTGMTLDELLADVLEDAP